MPELGVIRPEPHDRKPEYKLLQRGMRVCEWCLHGRIRSADLRPGLLLAAAGMVCTGLTMQPAWRLFSILLWLLLAYVCLFRTDFRLSCLKWLLPLTTIVLMTRAWVAVLPSEWLVNRWLGRLVTFQGEVCTLPPGSASAQDYIMALIDTGSGGRIAVGGAACDLVYGSTVEIEAWICAPTAAANPGGFSQKDWLAGQAVYLYADPVDAEAISSVRAAPAFSLLRFGLTCRRFFHDQAGRFLAERQAALLSGLILGETSWLSDWQKLSFRYAGLSHLTSVSGANVTFVMIPLAFLLSRLRLRRFWRLAAQMILAVGFGFLTGWQTGVLRSVVMILLIMLGRIFFKKADALNLLALTAWLMVLMDPVGMLGYSFWLSFLATASLIVLLPAMESLWQQHFPNCPDWIATPLCATGCAQLAVLPISCVLSHEINLLAWLINLPAQALTEYLTLAGLCSLAVRSGLEGLAWSGLNILTDLTGLLDILLHACLDSPLRLLAWLADLGGLTDWGRIPAAWLNAPVIIGLAGPVLFRLVGQSPGLSAGLFTRIRPAVLYRTAAVLIGAGVLLTIGRTVLGPDWRVWFLSVGQGDATLLESREGPVMLIDGGPSDSGYDVILPALIATGHRRIQLAVLTHGHADHAGGLLELLAMRRIDCLVLPALFEADYQVLSATIRERAGFFQSPDQLLDGLGPESSSSAFVESDQMKQAMILAIWTGCPVQFWKKHDTINLSRTDRLTVLAPATDIPAAAIAADPNQACLIFRMDLGRSSWLMMADCTEDTERQLLAATTEDTDLLSDLDGLKVAHHGSGVTTSWEWLIRVRPEWAVISVGYNSYGHPSPQVLDRLQRAYCPYWRTDWQGAIRLDLYPDRTLLTRHNTGGNH